MVNHDSLPTHKFCLANLSCVFRSNRQEIAIPSITNRNRLTHKPESEEVPMFRKILEVTFWVKLPWRRRGAETGARSARMTMGFVCPSSRVTTSASWIFFTSAFFKARASLRRFTLSDVVRKELTRCLSIGCCLRESLRVERSDSVMEPNSASIVLGCVAKYCSSCWELTTASWLHGERDTFGEWWGRLERALWLRPGGVWRWQLHSFTMNIIRK